MPSSISCSTSGTGRFAPPTRPSTMRRSRLPGTSSLPGSTTQASPICCLWTATWCFPAADVERLVAADKPLIGAVYPHRHNFPLLHAIALGRELEPARALAMATRFVVYYQGETGQ